MIMIFADTEKAYNSRDRKQVLFNSFCGLFYDNVSQDML
jgi:hypothetical protein